MLQTKVGFDFLSSVQYFATNMDGLDMDGWEK